MGDDPAYAPALAPSDSNGDEIFIRSIDDLALSTRTRNTLTKAGITTIGELARLTDEDLLDLRNFGATSVAEVREKLRRVAVAGHEFLDRRDATDREPTLTRLQAARAQRLAVADLVFEVVRRQAGCAITFSEIHARVADELEFTAVEDHVREGLRLHVRTKTNFVKVARDVYAWAPDGKVPLPPAPPHVVDMIERRWQGETLDEIGAAHDLTRERIRQLLQKYGGPTAEDVRERRTACELKQQRDREDAVVAAVRRTLDQRGPMTVAEVAEVTGHDAVEISRAWPEDLAYLRLHTSGHHGNQWSDEAILGAIRDAALYEFPLTTSAYSELLSQGQIKGPSMPRIGQRFGSWTAACEAAGVVAGQTMRTNYQSHWSDDDLLQIVRRYLLDPDTPNSAHRFDEWKRVAAPDGPSFQTLRNRFGSWTKLKRRALAQEGGEPRE